MEKIIIVSIYDDGYGGYSFTIGNRIFYSYSQDIFLERLFDLCLSYNNVGACNLIRDFYPDVSTLIICNNGDIEVYNVLDYSPLIHR